MPQETLIYQADGITLRGDLFRASGSDRKAGILVFPEAYGLNDHARERAERLAKLGYVALAADLHGDGRMIDDLPEALKLLQPLYADPSRIRARTRAALQALAGHTSVDAGRIGAIGFCFGGTMALELARSGAAIKAAVGFHSGLATKMPAGKGDIGARVLVCIGADDPFIKPEERARFEEEMRGTGADWQMHLYGGTVHSFTTRDAARRQMPEAIRYDANADVRSWAAMQEMFAETLDV